MTAREMQSSFEYKANQYDSEAIMHSHLIFHWLNEAQNEIVKSLFEGDTKDKIAFGQTQRIVDDLSILVKESKIPTSSGSSLTIKPNSFVATLPADYYHKVGESSTIEFTSLNGGSTIVKVQGVTESTSDTFNSQYSDPYSEHKLHYETAKPLRLFKQNFVELITDGNYSVTFYHLRYLRLPVTIGLDLNDCELPEHLHYEVVNYALSLYFKSIGDNRYPAYKQDLNQN